MKAEDIEARLNAAFDGMSDEEFRETLDDEEIEYFSTVEPLGIIPSASLVNVNVAAGAAWAALLADSLRRNARVQCEFISAHLHSDAEKQHSDASIEWLSSVLKDWLGAKPLEKAIEISYVKPNDFWKCERSAKETDCSIPRVPMKAFQDTSRPGKEAAENEHLALAA